MMNLTTFLWIGAAVSTLISAAFAHFGITAFAIAFALFAFCLFLGAYC